MSYVILRPSTFTVGASSLIGALGPSIERWRVAFVPRPDTKRISFITLSDVAEALVAAALDDGPSRAIDLGGGEAITMIEGAHRIGVTLGKKVRIVRLPRFMLRLMRRFAERRSFGAYEALLFLEMLTDHGYDCDPTPARELLGHEPVTIDNALRDYYATTKLTPWSESNLGVLRSRAR